MQCPLTALAWARQRRCRLGRVAGVSVPLQPHLVDYFSDALHASGNLFGFVLSLGTPDEAPKRRHTIVGGDRHVRARCSWIQPA